MATYTKLSSGSWRVQVRRKGRYVSETFLRRDDARRWATDAERQVNRGETPTKSRIARLKTFGELIDLHIDDMCDVGKSPLRSKAATLDMLRSILESAIWRLSIANGSFVSAVIAPPKAPDR